MIVNPRQFANLRAQNPVPLQPGIRFLNNKLEELQPKPHCPSDARRGKKKNFYKYGQLRTTGPTGQLVPRLDAAVRV